MTRRGVPDDTTVITLAERTGLTVEQVEIGIEIAKSGCTDVLNAVIAGRISVLEALAEVRRSHIKEG